MVIRLILLLVGFTLAMCGVIVLFEFDVWRGFALAVVGSTAMIGATTVDV